jgi:tRNA 2-thiocytidine biosynthesis protein TtcA
MRRRMEPERRLLREVGRTVVNHRLIDHGDRILVAMSGGKDSYGLLVLLRDLQRRAPVAFELVAVHLDQGHPGYDGAKLRAWLESEGVPFHMLRQDTYSIVTDKIPEGKTYCSLCSRLRRGILYRAADEFGCNKIALGHHGDDAIETLLLNLFFSGKLSAMAPRLVSDDGRHVVIRPLITCAETDLAALAAARNFPILPCNLCGSQAEAQRKQMKTMIANLEAKHPTVRSTMLAALGNVIPSHLMDPSIAKTATATAATAAEAEATAAAAAAAAAAADGSQPGPASSLVTILPKAALLRRP